MAKTCAHFIFGDEPLLISEKVEQLKKTAPSHAIEIWENQAFESIHTLATSGSLFASQYLILAKDPSFLKKTPSDKEIKLFKDILEAINANNHVLIIYCPNGRPDMRKKIPALLKKAAQCTELSAFKDWEQNKLIEWAQKRMTDVGKSLNYDAAQFLAESAGNSLSILSQTLKTLEVFAIEAQTLTITHVQELSGDEKCTAYQLTEAIKSGKHAETLRIARQLMQNGEEPVKLAGLIASSIRLYYQILLLNDAGESSASMAKKLGKNPYFIQKLLPDIKRRHNLTRLKDALFQLAKADYNLKTGKMKPKDAVICALSRFALSS
jgi:DNA polymerase III subunit delta